MGVRRRAALRAALATASALAATAVAWVCWPSGPETVAFMERSASERAELAALSAREASAPPPKPGRLARRPLGPDVRGLLLPLASANRGNVFHDRAYYVYAPHFERRVPFEWHPNGGFWIRSNALGLKGTREVAAERPPLRVLVVGDSHIDGFCDDEENVARLLEPLLETHLGIAPVEVLNAAHGGYSFYQYLGVLERHLDLEPDVFVVAVYAGNDFRDGLWLRSFYGGVLGDRCLNELQRYQPRLRGWPGGFLGQFARQLMHFNELPENEGVAIDTAVRATLEMAEICRAHDIVFVPFLLPAFADAQPAYLDVDLAAFAAKLDLTAHDLASATRMSNAWIEHSAAHGVVVLDPREHFAAAEEPLYWPRDHHLSVAGHAWLAPWLADGIAKRVAEHTQLAQR